jgi:selenocysteine-specific elongation factor
MHFIVGTAGHIDHGKTALVRALTGEDTDRLKEEKERGISIDLGFARLALADGSVAGVVDVPGHERFIRNMLAGAHGIDLALFVVAADDGVMPQSEEHLDLLHLLGVPSGVVVVTKSDLATPERLAEVREEVEILVDGTVLEGAPVVEVASTTGAGIARLRSVIDERLAAGFARPARGGFRLPVDRAFVIHGHGVVVTGTATSGTVRVGDAVRLLPGGDDARVRSLQVHGADVDRAERGQRVALNLAGLSRTDVRRGFVVVEESLARTTARFDARVEIRPLAKKPVPSRRRVRLHLGTSEVLATLVWLGGKTAVAPRERAHAQLVCDEPIVAFRGDRFILRRESADRTLGGGVVVHPFPPRHRARDEAVPAALEGVADADPGTALRAVLGLDREIGRSASWIATALDVAEAAILTAAREDGEVTLLPSDEAPEILALRERWEAWRDRLVEALGIFHRENPLLPGIEMEPLRTSLPGDVPAKLFRSLVDRLAAERRLVREESVVRLPTHKVEMRRDEQETTSRFEALLESGGFTPPDVKQLAELAKLPAKRVLELLRALERTGSVAKVAEDLYYPTATIDRVRELVTERIRTAGGLGAADFRDAIGASRKFAIALLEYLDRTGFTIRVGDVRKLRKG